jgi:hypothetical protein
MMKITYDNGFKNFQQFDFITKSIKFFDDIFGYIVFENDSFHIEYDETVGHYVVLHKSSKFNEKRPICYVSNDNFSMKKFHAFFYSCLKEAWVEYLI